MTLNEPFDSADKLLEEYQRKLKHSQKLKNITSKSSSLNNSNSVEKNIDNSTKFEDSIGSLETQLIDQFRQYKSITKKLEDAKKELYLSTQIEVSVKAYKDLDKAYQQKNSNLENEFFERKKLLEQDIELLNEKKVSLKKKNDDVFNNLEKEKNIQIYKNSVLSESDLCVKYEGLQHEFINIKFDFLNKEASLSKNLDDQVQLNNNKISELKKSFLQEVEIFDRKKAELKLSIDSHRDELLSLVKQEMDCISFEYNQMENFFLKQLFDLEEKVKFNDKTLTKQLLNFNDQLDQKKQIWDKEKVLFFEEIANEKLLWNQEKQETLLELELKEKKLDSEIKQFETDRLNQEKLWKESQQFHLNEIATKKNDLEAKINLFLNDLDLLDKKKLRKSENIEQLNMILFEKDSYLDFKLQLIDSEVDLKRKVLLSNLEDEMKQLKSLNASEINKINDKQGIELSLRLNEFEEDLANRKKAFEEELVQKRQQIILESKREQKLEFNHVLQFEKNKFSKELDGLNDQIKDRNIEINKLEKKIIDQKNKFQNDIEEILSEKESLSNELIEVENLTRKSVMVNYEEKYKHLLDSYKHQSMNQINLLKTKLTSSEVDIKNKDVKIRELQLNIKKLESELNRQIIKDSTTDDDTFTFTKVIRSKNRN